MYPFQARVTACSTTATGILSADRRPPKFFELLARRLLLRLRCEGMARSPVDAVLLMRK
jgi:hypothetical protein